MGDNQASNSMLVLDPRLDLTVAAGLCAALKEHRGNDLTINAEAVEHLGSQCLQALLSAAATWRADGAALSYSAQSTAFSDALKNFGLPADALVVGGEN